MDKKNPEVTNTATDESSSQKSDWGYDSPRGLKNLSREERASILQSAENIVKSYRNWSIGVGLVPIPLVDIAAIATTQLLMLRALCRVYRVHYQEDRGKRLTAALAGGIATPTLGLAGASLLKAIPFVGIPAAILATPAAAGASTYAVGKVFIQHFESGGNLLTFDPQKKKEYYARMVSEGQQISAR